MQAPDGTVEHGGCQWAHIPKIPRHGHARDREQHNHGSDRRHFLPGHGPAFSSPPRVCDGDGGLLHTAPPHSQTPAVSLGCVPGQITFLRESRCLCSGMKPAPTSCSDTEGMGHQRHGLHSEQLHWLLRGPSTLLLMLTPGWKTLWTCVST